MAEMTAIERAILYALERSGGVKMAYGSYVGNGTVNRAIAHGLGAIPRAIFWQSYDPAEYVRIGAALKTNYHKSSGHGYTGDQTASDATNFYVGLAADYGNSCNFAGMTYYWVAFA